MNPAVKASLNHAIRVLSWFFANHPSQVALGYTVKTLQAFMGVGTGSRVESGESASIRQCISSCPIILDIGANTGQFAALVRSILRNKPYKLSCFEPSKTAFLELKKNISESEQVHLFNIAVGNPGVRTLHYDVPGSSLASLTRRNLNHVGREFTMSEEVTVESLDEIVGQLEYSHIDLLKIDVEGHELEVLQSAPKLFSTMAVDAVQFEFGGCNIDTRTYLRDFFEFFQDANMTIHRITPCGYLHAIRRYREMDEQFGTTNFLAKRNS